MLPTFPGPSNLKAANFSTSKDNLAFSPVFGLFIARTEKTKHPFQGMLCFGYEIKTGVEHNSIDFQDSPMFSHMIE